MKRLLPIFISFVSIFVVLFSSPLPVFAQPATQIQPGPTDSRWVIDPEVTFIGKNAARAGEFLDWTLKNYNWVCVKQISNGAGNIQCDNTNNPIEQYWSLIVLYIVVPMLFLVILATAIVIIITRGKSLTIMRFIPRFIAVVLLIVFSYSLLQFLYQFTDLIQGFFLRSDIKQACPPICISQKDLLYVGWDYTNFIGLRLLGDKYAESAFISLLLTKLTALTYFVMVFLLLVRKIILWFFIIVSPIFPILLLYYPVRNTGKIWIGEFFRWLLYAPLFAIFLNGLVYLWRSSIPLTFNNPNIGNANAIEYPTAVNILLGGPRQQVTPNNSINLPETFALYVVSLIMLWIVILLPWILLQIFLDYAQNFAPGDTAVMKTLVNLATSPKGSGPSPAPAEGGGGAAIALPFAKKFNIPTTLQPGPTGAAKELRVENATVNTANFSQPAFIPNAAINNASVNASVLNTADIKLPSMRDIARFDIALASQDQSKQQEVSRFSEQLVKISNPIAVTNTVEKDQYREIREKITERSQQGNLVANSIMNAANSLTRSSSQASTSDVKKVLEQIANPASASTSSTSAQSREKLTKLHDTLQKESRENNNQLASSLLSISEKTSASEIEKIREQLSQAVTRGDKTASSVLSTINSESQKSQTLSQTQSVLKQIANPSSVTNATERETFTKLHDSLQKESKENNSQLASSLLSVNEKTSASEIEKIREQLSQAVTRGDKTASSVLSTINNATQSSQASAQTRNVLKNIANPASVTNTAERAMFTQLHDSLQKESKENNNSLASSILQVNDSTSVTELDKIREQLMQSKENTVIQSVNNMVQQNQSTTHVKSVLQEVANPDTAKVVNKEKVNKLHETLQKASTQGNQLAASILKVNDKTSVEEIEALKQKIQDAKIKGEPLATELSNLTQVATAATLPGVNKVQSVRKEDYQAVKDMWKQNYQNLEIPQGMAGSRTDWIKDDIKNIDETIALLSSPDQDKQQQGMDQVSNLLPFLLVGGFSQTEIIEYLKAKQSAAQEVSTSLAVEEEDKVGITTRATHATQTMTATMTEESGGASSGGVSSGEEEGESPLTSISNVTNISNITYTQPEISNEILNMVNVKVPKLKDIAQFETKALRKDVTSKVTAQSMQNVLTKIANPTQITDVAEREKFEKIHDKLRTEQQQGNPTASFVLNAAERAEGRSSEQIKSVLSQIANPSTVTSLVVREKFTQLHDSLQKESKENNNSLASSILQVNDSTSVTELDKIREQLMQSKENTVIQSVNNMVQQNQSTTHVKSVLQEVANPEKASVINKEKINKLHESLQKASTQGNQLASSILKVNDKTSVKEIEALQQKIQDANVKGEPIAAELSSLAQQATKTSLPTVNKVQTVSKEDYQAVKDMWKQNYQNLEVPQGMAGSRTDWIKEDIASIDETVKLLSSADPQKVQQGMDQVSSVLPFLLAGGFSQTEIIEYLKAKQEAAKEVSTQLASEEEQQMTVSASTQHTQTQQTMSTSVSNDTSDAGVPEEESTLNSQALAGAPVQQVNISNEFLTKAELTIPKMIDIARYETRKVTKNKEEAKRQEKVNEALMKIANPTKFVTDKDRQKFEDLRQKLAEESQKGDVTAGNILSAATSTTDDEAAANLPATNQTQAVSQQDYDDVRKLWEENYRKLPLPAEYGSDRIAWIKADTAYIEETIGMLISPDTEKQKEGMKRVSDIMPMLLLGGFSTDEVVGYLKAKLEAGKNVLSELQKEEESQVKVAAKPGEEQEKAQKAEENS